MEEWRDTFVVEGGAAAGSRSSEAKGDLFVSEVGVYQKDTEEGQESFGQVKAPWQKKKSNKTCRVGGDTTLTCQWFRRVTWIKKWRQRTSRTWSAVSEPRCAEQNASSSSKLRLLCQK